MADIEYPVRMVASMCRARREFITREEGKHD